MTTRPLTPIEYIELNYEPVYIDADPVRRWVERVGQESGEYPEVPEVLSPFPNSIYRYGMLSKLPGGIVVPPAYRPEIECQIYCVDLNDVERHEGWRDDTRWVQTIDVAMDGDIFGSAMVEISQGGAAVSGGARYAISDSSIPFERGIALLKALFWPALMTISLLHCKNVELIDRPISRQQRRMAERKGQPLIQYKTLIIEPFKKQVRAETKPGESQLARALHICRGHFREYSEERPLFGRYAGRYWIPMHARGSSKKGVIVKDYEIKP